MSWDDLKDKHYVDDNNYEKERFYEEDKVKEPIYRSTTRSYFYSIFRVGRKFKQQNGITNSGLNMIKAFQKHMEREIEVINSDDHINNEILIGNTDIYGTVREYIKDIKLRKNSVVARELLMTASPGFFKGLSNAELQKWKNENLKWLKENYGNNCVYAILHKDESTWHIHSLIVPKFENEKGENILSNTRYFDGIEKMRGWQDNYAMNMNKSFQSLNRGIKYSKAKHMEIRHYYALINQNINENDIEQLAAKAKNEELLKIKLKSIEKTLEIYKKYNGKNELEKDNAISESKKLYEDLERIKDDKDTYKEAISLLSQQYKIPQYAIKNAIKFTQNINEKEK